MGARVIVKNFQDDSGMAISSQAQQEVVVTVDWTREDVLPDAPDTGAGVGLEKDDTEPGFEVSESLLRRKMRSPPEDSLGLPPDSPLSRATSGDASSVGLFSTLFGSSKAPGSSLPSARASPRPQIPRPEDIVIDIGS